MPPLSKPVGYTPLSRGGASRMVYAFSEYEIDENRFELRYRGEKVPVQPKALELLRLLVANRERVSCV
jgi:DNA-binding winged helix-turn-helix (wHTH) protein